MFDGIFDNLFGRTTGERLNFDFVFQMFNSFRFRIINWYAGHVWLVWLIVIALLIACYVLSITPMLRIVEVRKLQYRWLVFIPIVGFIYVVLATPRTPYTLMGVSIENRVVAFAAVTILTVVALFVPQLVTTHNFVTSLLMVVLYLAVLLLNGNFLNDLFCYFDGANHVVLSTLAVIFPIITAVYLVVFNNNVPSDVFTDYGNYERGTFADTGITEEELPLNLEKFKHNMRELDYRQHRDSDYSASVYKLKKKVREDDGE